MDNFDKFIKDKSKEEKESFRLPKSFEDKIDFILENVDNEKRIDRYPWYRNRKIISIAACFIFSCFILIRLVYKGNVNSSADGSTLKITNNAGSAEDSSYGLFSEEKLESSISISLIGESTEVRDMQGDASEFNSFVENRAASSYKDEQLQTLVVSRNENIKIEFSSPPNSYKINLVGEKSEEYFSENFIVKAPSEIGIYLFELIAYWDNEEIKYTVKIQVED